MNIAVIFAGGVGSRMKTKDGTPKQFLEIDGVPILIYTLRNFQYSEEIDAIVVVMKEGYLDTTQELIEKYGISKVKAVIPGGETGQESIYHGLLVAEKIAGEEDTIVLIHDGVRPFIEDGLIERNIESVKKYGSAISCVPSKETIVRLNEEQDLQEVIDRSTVWLARAPQSFYLEDILAAHKEALANGKKDTIDSCTMMINAGKKLHMVETCAENIKITTPEDYYAASGLVLREKEKENE